MNSTYHALSSTVVSPDPAPLHVHDLWIALSYKPCFHCQPVLFIHIRVSKVSIYLKATSSISYVTVTVGINAVRKKNTPLLALSFRMSIRSYITFASPGRFCILWRSIHPPEVRQLLSVAVSCPHVAGNAQYMFFIYAVVYTYMCDICCQICYLKPEAMFLLKTL
jgi:hypothetical protein